MQSKKNIVPLYPALLTFFRCLLSYYDLLVHLFGYFDKAPLCLVAMMPGIALSLKIFKEMILKYIKDAQNPF